MRYCEEYAALLDLYVDGELSPEDMVRVQSHLEECPVCQSYVDDALAIRAAFPDVEDTVVPDGFAEGVMAAIQAGTAPQKKKKAPWAKVLLPLAACCAIVILLQNGDIFAGRKEEAAITMDTAAEAAVEAPAAPAAEEESPAETEMALLESSRVADAKQNYEEPAEAPKTQAAGQALSDAEMSSASNVSVFAALTLTAEDAGSLLDAYAPLTETETEVQYQLSAEDYNDLLTRLTEAEIPFTQTFTGISIADTGLVIVQK